MAPLRLVASLGLRSTELRLVSAVGRSSLWYPTRLSSSPYASLSLRKFSAEAVEKAAKQAGDQKQQSRRWWSPWWYRLAVLVRYARIPALVLGVYSLGYQQGIMDCTKTPKLLQNKIMNTILAGQGVTDMSHVHIVGEADIRQFSAHRHHHVASVGQKIIKAAREHVQAKLLESMEKVRSRLPHDMSDNVLQEHYRKDEECEFWYEAGLRLLGEDDRPWQYIFIQTGLPNAFVTEMLPQRFFITTGLLDLAGASADELAFVLGHEISHLILGHVSKANQMETILRTVEVLLLSIDPTSGVVALFFIGGLAAIRRALTAAHSRDNEREADDLGIEIAARACFNTVAGAKVMKKMYHLSTLESPLSTTGTQVTNLYDSHPPSRERYESLLLRAENYNREHFSHCHGILQRFYHFLWSKPSGKKTSSETGTAKMEESVE